MMALGVAAHGSLLSHEEGTHSSELPKPVKPKGVAFVVASPCSSPVILARGLCDCVTKAWATHG